MAITKEKKEKIVNKLKDVIKNSPTIVFANFHGLNVSETNILRRELKQSKIDYLVAKKTLVKKSFENGKIGGEMPDLEGELSLAFGNDQIEPARKILSFQKKFEDRIKILGGVFDGSFINMQKMVEIAQIPSREILYAQFVNIINSPIQGFIVAVDQIAKSK